MTQRVAARSGGGGGVVSPPVPVMSKDLAYVVGTLVEPDGFAARRITLAMREEAASMLAAATARCKPPANDGPVEAWLLRLGDLGVNRTPVGEAWDSMAGGVWLASSDLPAAVWSLDSMRLAARAWKGWPAPAEIDEFLRAIGKRLLRELDALKKIATPPPGTAPVPPVEPDMPIAEFVKSIERKHGYQMRGFDGQPDWKAPPTAPPPPAPARASTSLRRDALAALRAQNPTIQAARAASVEE